MTGFSLDTVRQFGDYTEIWHNLKQAIAISSGFQRWQLELHTHTQLPQMSIDEQVQLYLRETLETLAY